MKASLYHFLVAAHRLERAGGREIADRWKRAELRRMLGLRQAKAASASNLGIPVNLFDAMRVVLQKRPA